MSFKDLSSKTPPPDDGKAKPVPVTPKPGTASVEGAPAPKSS